MTGDAEDTEPALEGEGAIIDALTRVLVKTCRRLADVGYPQEAGRLAASGWTVVRRTHSRQAQHLDGAMHHIARVEARLEQARNEQAGQPATDAQLGNGTVLATADATNAAHHQD